MNNPSLGLFANYRAKKQMKAAAASGARQSALIEHGDTDAQAARKAERNRWATVLKSERGKSHREAAISLLADSEASASTIIMVLETVPAAPSAQERWDRRLASYKTSREAAEAQPKSAAETSASIVNAYNRALGRSGDA